MINPAIICGVVGGALIYMLADAAKIGIKNEKGNVENVGKNESSMENEKEKKRHRRTNDEILRDKAITEEKQRMEDLIKKKNSD